jgi:hypothetical protein
LSTKFISFSLSFSADGEEHGIRIEFFFYAESFMKNSDWKRDTQYTSATVKSD